MSVTIKEFNPDQDIFSVTNSALREGDQEKIDAEILTVSRKMLIGLEDLRQNGLVTSVGNFGTMFSSYERVGTMSPATVSMGGEVTGELNKVSFDKVSVPIPLISTEYRINARSLEASRNGNSPLDTTSVAIATTSVAETVERGLFRGFPVIVEGSNVYGYTNHPSRTQVTLSGGATGWSNDNAKVIEDVSKLLEAAYATNSYGPFHLYVSRAIWAKLQNDYTPTKSDKTYIDRILAFADINAVKSTSELNANEVLLVQMDKRTVDVALAVDFTNIMLPTVDPFVFNFRVFCALAPRIKVDKGGNCGLIHGIGK